MLYIGEKVGSAQGSGPKIDIALDPLEGHDDHRQGRAQRAGGAGDRREAAACSTRPTSIWRSWRSGRAIRRARSTSTSRPADNVRALAKAKGVEPSEIIACVLDRPRHAAIIAELRALGCGIKLIPDGDVAGVIAIADPDTGDRHLYRHRRRARGRARRRGAALRRRPDPGPAGVPQRRRSAAARSAGGSTISTASTRSRTWPRATASSPPPASPTARC